MSLSSSHAQELPLPVVEHPSLAANVVTAIGQDAYLDYQKSLSGCTIQYFINYAQCPVRKRAFRKKAEIQRVVQLPEQAYQAAFKYGFHMEQDPAFAGSKKEKTARKELGKLFKNAKNSVSQIGWEAHPDHHALTRSNKRNITTKEALLDYRANHASQKLMDIAHAGYTAGKTSGQKYKLINPLDN